MTDILLAARWNSPPLAGPHPRRRAIAAAQPGGLSRRPRHCQSLSFKQVAQPDREPSEGRDIVVRQPILHPFGRPPIAFGLERTDQGLPPSAKILIAAPRARVQRAAQKCDRSRRPAGGRCNSMTGLALTPDTVRSPNGYNRRGLICRILRASARAPRGSRLGASTRIQGARICWGVVKEPFLHHMRFISAEGRLQRDKLPV